MDRLSYIKAWATTTKRVKVRLNGEEITTVDQPSEAFNLGLAYDSYDLQWDRVDLFQIEENAGEKLNKRDIKNLTKEAA